MREILVVLMIGMVVGVGMPVATADGDHDVEIRDGAFVPERVEVEAGDTVEWRNEGQQSHSATADDGTFDSGALEPGGTFEARFDEAGTYQYHSSSGNDEGMVGVVVVLPADPSASSGPGEEGTAASEAAGDPAKGTGSSDAPADQAPAEGAVTDTAGSAASEAKPGAPASVGSSGPVLAQAAAVSIQDDVFVPRRVEVDAGGTVAWQHAGQRPHTVTASDGSFDSGTMESGDPFSQTFSQPGTYSYYCRFHGSPSGEGMAGVVVVRGAPGDADGEAPAPGEQEGGLAATGLPVVGPLGVAVALLVAGIGAIRLSRPRRTVGQK
jgi:plastocyanin